MPVTYEQTQQGWENAARSTNANGAIHPAGNKGAEEYAQSGMADANNVLTLLDTHVNVHTSFKDSTIIDLGCGNGRVTTVLQESFKKIYAIDASYAMLQQLPRIDTIEPVLSTNNAFELPELVDCAFSISVFIHNNYTAGKQLMLSLGNNMKSGGIALLQIPIYDVAREPETWTDVGVWTLQQLKDAAHFTGFDIREVNTNPGSFSFSDIGPNHHKFQILQKI